MSVQTEITRLQTARNTIRTKLVELGLVASSAKIDDCATAVSLIDNQGAVSANVMEGDTYTIPKGYHNGSGTVSGIAGGGNYTLQAKIVSPTKSQQNVTADQGYYGLSGVTVSMIPDNYQDVTAVTATAADVLATKVFVDSLGAITAGTMVDNGAVSKTLSTSSTSYTIPEGYHNGSGKVSITTQSKTVTPTKSAITVTPDTSKVLSSVVVSAIPDTYIDTTLDDTVGATAADILEGKKAYVNGTVVIGTMANNGDVSATIIGLLDTNNSVTIPAGYTSGGTVSLTTDIETALAAI